MTLSLRYLSFFIIILLSFFNQPSKAQQLKKTNDAEWKLVQNYLDKGLPKSALTEVKKIYQSAKRGNDEAQVIRAIIYMIDLQNDNRENAEITSIQELEKEIAISTEPAKSILTSLLAKKYYQYFMNHRWEIHDRTTTTGFKNDAVDSWSTEDFLTKISMLYRQSLQQEQSLKQNKLTKLDPIIDKGNTRKLRPTLFDLLAQEALQYFSRDEHGSKSVKDVFEINSAPAFDPAADFIHRKFKTEDTSSNNYQVLKLYQRLIAFHIEDTKPDALIDVDLQRLQYLKWKSVHPDSDTLYIMSVHHVADQYQDTPAAAQAWYLTAHWHYENAVSYDAGSDTTNRFEKIKAAEICEQIIRKNPETEGGINAYNLLQTIRNRNFQYTTENVNIPEKPFLMFVEYQNINKIYLRVIAATEEMRIKIRSGLNSKNANVFTSAVPKRAWEQTLPEGMDYQKHGVEIKVDALPTGEYFIVAADNADFKNPKTVLGVRQLYISNISYVQNKENFFVLNRDTGQPLSQAKIRIWQTTYDNRVSDYLKLKSELFTTDNNGFLKRKQATASQNPTSEVFEITYENDRLFMQNSPSTYYNFENETVPKKRKVYLFTDRSIYRPGQVVYYKGIVTKDDSLFTLNSDIPVILKNANGEEIEKVVTHVNNFGSFSGKFQLPSSSLNGQFSIYIDDDFSTTFHVEEYKRPTFAITFDTLKNTYKLNDSIRISGIATAFAGNAIDGAKVSYRVVRNARFIYTSLYKGTFLPRPPMEITHGEILTNQSGKFSISFEATPDRKVSKSSEPVFDYTIYTDVTDSNGETRSGETIISAGYRSLLLKTNIDDEIQTDSLKTLSIRTENMNGIFIDSTVTVKMTRLKPETRLIRERLWKRPDLFVMSKSEFISFFPSDEYAEESDFQSWPVDRVVFEKTKKISSEKGYDISETKFEMGFYKIEISTLDDSGEIIKDIRYVEITDPKSTRLNRPQYLVNRKSTPIEPGEKTIINLGTSADQVFLISHSTRKEKGDKPFSFFSLNNERRTFEFSATEADRGGYPVDYLFVKHNRIYRYAEVIQVPWANKDLKIEHLTFRDKTLPGSKEKWKVKITGYKKDKIAAEMLASMYDASLDQFYPHQWNRPDIWQNFTERDFWDNSENFSSDEATLNPDVYPILNKTLNKQYDAFKWEDFYTSGNLIKRPARAKQLVNIRLAGKVAGLKFESNAPAPYLSYDSDAPMESPREPDKKVNPSENVNYTRKNFNETAFFSPDLLTNEKGEIEFSFSVPEALTRWKFQALAHTKDLALGYSMKDIITQKDLMIQPNAPRFLREGDKISFSAKVVNFTDKEINGTVSFQLFDTETNQPVNDLFRKISFEQSFTLKGKESKAVQFPIEVPAHFTKILNWRIVAKSNSHADGEENFLPVLSNRILVTEMLPLSVRGGTSKNFKFDKLLNSNLSKTLTNQSLTVEFTENPAWYAVQALPYLAESRYECAEQIWNRYYANALAAKILESSPRISKIFETWRISDTTALLSNLQKNQELKSILLEETPWVLAAKTEAQQKKNIALLFDLHKISNELKSNFDKIEQSQNSNGAFSWFKGGPDDRYMTQYILSGFGHLRNMGAVDKRPVEKIEIILRKGINYLDQQIKSDFDLLIKQKTDLKKVAPNPDIIQYLYMRSFFEEIPVPAASQKAFAYFLERTKLSWVFQSTYMQGLIALTLHRRNEKEVPNAILKSLKETSINDESLGMYWKSSQKGWWWYEAPIERQALFIEAFQEISQDEKIVNDLKTWLLKNKQSNNWGSSKATAEACYALLLQGKDILSNESSVHISLGELNAKSTEQEAGTGYFKTVIEGEKVKPEMGKIKVEVTSNTPAKLPVWGAIFWQYFENIDKITQAETSLKLTKTLFVEKNSNNGPILTAIKAGEKLNIGDKIKVRIELRVDRDMEYVHMKDLRASSFEPMNVLSGYKYQGGLGYYESTRDASTDFFFDRLRKGNHVFEYPLFVTQEGNFANGITSIQCMYAPEFAGHSEGMRVEVGR